MHRTKEGIAIKKGTPIKSVNNYDWYELTLPSGAVIYLSASLVEEVKEEPTYTEPGWKPMKTLEDCKVVLILSDHGRIKKPYIGMRSTNGEYVLRDTAQQIKEPCGWKEI